MRTDIDSDFNACMHRDYCRRLHSALMELVNLKTLKDGLMYMGPGVVEARAEYERRMPAAWAEARTVLFLSADDGEGQTLAERGADRGMA
jgi:hypothetical protein